MTIPARRWLIRTPDPARVETLLASTPARALALSPLLACLLINRGLDTPEKAAAFLSPSLRE
ncbi:MAG: hypothetical protein HY268_32450 [Deltaproteobacteria bacterium]|nr:hypothetical protein [Deltaproteobacteria bacterium]